MDPYLPYILISAGILMMIIPFFKKSNPEELAKKGERCDGIIFKVVYERTLSNGGTAGEDTITVRFVTQKQEWITENLDTDDMILWTGKYKEGQKVRVVYNPDNPTEFMLENSKYPKTTKLIFILGGLIFLGYGIYKYLTTN
ncbi:MAG: DUF3592 domain-containing protein [Bacteroidota bacterium]